MKPQPLEKNKQATDHSTQRHWNEMNRKQRREMMRKIQSENLSLEVVHPHAAGIDIGNEFHYVAVPPGRDSIQVRRYGCTTDELKAMASWLSLCGIRTVAMQSTGVYWIAVYDILQAAGFEVYLVNARDTKNLPGRKTDVQESQWLMKLHTYGLLRNSFRPPQEVRVMRTYWRQRNDLIQAAASHIQRMQKVLTQMNIQLANVLSDISGVTGQAIIQAILAGERDAHKLAALRDPRVQASEEQIARYLEGNWQEDLLFLLKQEQEAYGFCQQQMAACDRQLEQYLQHRKDRSHGACIPEETRTARLQKKRKNKPQFDLRAELFRVTGTDLTQIDGIDVLTAATVLSEAGWDMSKFENDDHFVSWLRLCPNKRITGGKVIGKGRLPTNNRATIALRMAASTLRNSNTYLGAQFRRLRTKLGAPIATKAMAAKLARLVYRMMRYGMKYVDRGAKFYDAQHRDLQIRHLKWRAAKLGFRVVEASA
ncbi:MAG TPA: IS110 family transposase [Candidatus Acidoferrales bacterium]|jgi:transposase|nr:IS110 family transposase [Candidatus Acidoferrales bacterium]